MRDLLLYLVVLSGPLVVVAATVTGVVFGLTGRRRVAGGLLAGALAATATTLVLLT